MTEPTNAAPPPAGPDADPALAAVLANLRVVLTRTTHPGNIGAAARAMKCMGLSDLRLVTPRSFPDPIADARASGATDLLEAAGVHETLEEAVGDTLVLYGASRRSRTIEGPVLDVRDAARELVRLAQQGPVGILFGHERTGLENAELERCDGRLLISTTATFGSLNLGAAVQVVVHELRMAALAQHAGESAAVASPGLAMAPSGPPPAAHESVEALQAHLMEALDAVGYFTPGQANRPQMETRFRRLLARMRLDDEDVSFLRGMAARMNRAGWAWQRGGMPLKVAKPEWPQPPDPTGRRGGDAGADG